MRENGDHPLVQDDDSANIAVDQGLDEACSDLVENGGSLPVSCKPRERERARERGGEEQMSL